MTAHAHLEDLDRIRVGALTWRPVRERLGATAFGVNAWTADAVGDEVIESHTEGTASSPGHEELYLVVAGRATFTVGEEEIDAPVGTLVHVEVGTLPQRRGGRARDHGARHRRRAGRRRAPQRVGVLLRGAAGV